MCATMNIFHIWSLRSIFLLVVLLLLALYNTHARPITKARQHVLSPSPRSKHDGVNRKGKAAKEPGKVFRVDVDSKNKWLLKGGQSRVHRTQRNSGGDDKLKLLHSPCEFDLLTKVSVDILPSYCQPVYNNRFENEEAYRLFRTYDIEGFVFEQFYERLNRYEIDS